MQMIEKLYKFSCFVSLSEVEGLKSISTPLDVTFIYNSYTKADT
ncbi:hypothetical protein JM83_2456 [Gillisia sp. Hel_I_86]|nr:hypothetical protein JM83_2456 [Gillisia sp. Hel_I_86]